MARFKRRGPLTVTEMVERGIPLRSAVRSTLASRGETLASWCRQSGWDRHNLSRLLGGDQVGYEEMRTAVCRAFDIEREWLDKHLAAHQG